MKNLCLLVCMLLFKISIQAQVASPFWAWQNSSYTNAAAPSAYIDAVDSNVVWAIQTTGFAPNNSNQFTRTINGGASYTSGLVFPDTNTYKFSSIEAIDANTAWVTSFYKASSNMGALHTTTNGGVTWANVTPSYMYTNTTSFADFTCFLTPSVGITVGDPVGGEFEIYRTTDGGQTWAAIAGSLIPDPTSGEYALTDSYAKFGTNDIWFGTNRGNVFHSSNQGQSWSSAFIGSTSSVPRIAFRSAMDGILFTGASAFRTSNGGVSWTPLAANPNRGRRSICAVPGTSLYASCGDATGNTLISYTADDGNTWANWGGSNVKYMDIDFVSSKVGYAGGISNASNPTLDGMFKYTGADLSIMGGPAEALNFDGVNDQISLTHFPRPLDMTLEAWIKTTSSSVMQIIGWGGNTGNSAEFKMNGGTVAYCEWDGITFPCIVSGGTINDNLWHHVAVVRTSSSSSNISLYIDGLLVNVGTITSAITTNSLHIGAYNYFTMQQFYNGYMDEVKIWNRALSLSEIQNNMNCELPSPQIGLISYYKFNRGIHAANNSSITVCPDSSGNSNHGTLNNFGLNGPLSNWIAPGAVITGSTCAGFATDIKHNSAVQIDNLIYPNPSNGLFNVRVSSNCSLSITNTLGQQILEEKIDTENKVIDLTNQPDGMYFYKILGKVNYSGKLIKQ